MSEFNNWNVSFSTISFFSDVLEGHNKVESFQRINDIQFIIKHVNGTTINVLLVNEYSLGLATVLRAKNEFPDVDYIVTGGNWNGYTPEAKKYGMQNDLGIFNTDEFFGSLHWTEPKNYYKKDGDGNPTYAYKNT